MMKKRKNYPLRLPVELFNKLQRQADKEDLRINQLLNKLIREAMK